LEDRALQEALSAPLDASDVKTRTSKLWTMLDEAHRAANSLCRTKPHGQLTIVHARLINRVFEQVLELPGMEPYAKFLHLLDPDGQNTFSDALLLIGQYRAALRSFRVKELKQDSLSF
jgi:hypothetical protein